MSTDILVAAQFVQYSPAVGTLSWPPQAPFDSYHAIALLFAASSLPLLAASIYGEELSSRFRVPEPRLSEVARTLGQLFGYFAILDMLWSIWPVAAVVFLVGSLLGFRVMKQTHRQIDRHRATVGMPLRHEGD
jgi:hypothetical protein